MSACGRSWRGREADKEISCHTALPIIRQRLRHANGASGAIRMRWAGEERAAQCSDSASDRERRPSVGQICARACAIPARHRTHVIAFRVLARCRGGRVEWRRKKKKQKQKQTEGKRETQPGPNGSLNAGPRWRIHQRHSRQRHNCTSRPVSTAMGQVCWLTALHTDAQQLVAPQV